MSKLMVVLGSTRPGRVGKKIADWVLNAAKEFQDFEVDFVDLAELNLPFLDEPNHPRLKQYTQDHTKAWSARVESSDGFLFVFPEYNHSYSPAIKNALDFLHSEWTRKPVGFVNWGGGSGGTRAQAALRPVVTSLGMVMTLGNIEINHPGEQINNDVFEPNDLQKMVLDSQFKDIKSLIATFKQQ